MKKIVIIGGGTLSHVRNHLALCAPAYGTTAKELYQYFRGHRFLSNLNPAVEQESQYEIELILTKMADSSSEIETNQDVSMLLDRLIADSDVKAIIFNVALVDFTGFVGNVDSGRHALRLKTKNGVAGMTLVPAEKLIGKIRKYRKDIFVVGFKTTTAASSDEQYLTALELLKTNSLNLVLANDTVTRNNMIVAPEETRYSETSDRQEVLSFLTKMTASRMQNKFTRSTVVAGNSINWNGQDVPDSLRTVVNYCIENGAYKPFLGKTAGHFAVKVDDATILTSIRKTNFNHLTEVGLVKVESRNADEVIAHGFKPSVGGQSQRIIFAEHPDKDCIVHFHCPVKNDATEKGLIPVKDQWPNECGSHQCGQNTSQGLREVNLGNGDKLSVVFLDGHGPNIVFNKTTPPEKIINFINRNFDLAAKTGGLV